MDNETKLFLQESLLPALMNLMDVTKNMADGYAADHKAMITAQERQCKKDIQTQEITSLLVKSVDKLTEHIRELVNSINKSNELAARQSQLLETIRDSLAENTSQLGVMAMVQSEQTEDPGIKALYENLQRT